MSLTDGMRINEIFYSLQGEGLHAGTPAIFIRFAGCNLQCPFCDTDHRPFTEMSADEVIARAEGLSSCRYVVLTGGEPSLQITPEFIAALRRRGFHIAVETNGTRPLPEGIDWVTCSPKFTFCRGAELVLEHIDELKVIYTDENQDFSLYYEIPARYRFIQPCDTGHADRNRQILQGAIRFVKHHPAWRLSLQMHKILSIP